MDTIATPAQNNVFKFRTNVPAAFMPRTAAPNGAVMRAQIRRMVPWLVFSGISFMLAPKPLRNRTNPVHPPSPELETSGNAGKRREDFSTAPAR
jgi:hypothetical protein